MKATYVINAGFAAILGLTAFGTYTLKHDVEQTAQDLRALKAQIADEYDTINILNAEWAHLNRPERLHELARRYLPLQPLDGSQIVPLRDVPAALRTPPEE